MFACVGYSFVVWGGRDEASRICRPTFSDDSFCPTLGTQVVCKTAPDREN